MHTLWRQEVVCAALLARMGDALAVSDSFVTNVSSAIKGFDTRIKSSVDLAGGKFGQRRSGLPRELPKQLKGKKISPQVLDGRGRSLRIWATVLRKPRLYNMRWKTDELTKLVSPYCASVTNLGPGGDYDSDQLLLLKGSLKDFEKGKCSGLYLCGFTISDPSSRNPSDMEIDHVELTDGEDSAGGLNTSDPEICELYGKLSSLLRRKGYSVVRSLKDYF